MKRALPLFVLALAGCSTIPEPTVVAPSDLSDLTAQAAQASEQAERERALNSRQREKVAANLETAETANAQNPDGAPKSTTADAIRLAKANNGEAKPDPEQLLIGERIARAHAEGKAAEASKLVADSIEKAAEANAELSATRAKAKLDQDKLSSAISAKDKELATLKEKAKQDLASIIAKYEAQIAKERVENVREQQSYLNMGAIGLAGLAAILLAAGWFMGSVRKLAVGAGFCFMCSIVAFGLSQLVGESWYKWAILIGIVLVILYCLAVGWAHAERKEQAKVAEKVVPVLDEGYEDADEEQKKVLDELIFNPLSDKDTGMAAKIKATVHRLRANAKEKAAK